MQWEECQPFWIISHHICELRWVIHRCVILFDYLKLVDYRPQRTQRISFAYSSVFGHQIGCLHDVTHWTRQITSEQRFTECSSATVRNRRLPQPTTDLRVKYHNIQRIGGTQLPSYIALIYPFADPIYPSRWIIRRCLQGNQSGDEGSCRHQTYQARLAA